MRNIFRSTLVSTRGYGTNAMTVTRILRITVNSAVQVVMSTTGVIWMMIMAAYQDTATTALPATDVTRQVQATAALITTIPDSRLPVPIRPQSARIATQAEMLRFQQLAVPVIRRITTDQPIQTMVPSPCPTPAKPAIPRRRAGALPVSLHTMKFMP